MTNQFLLYINNSINNPDTSIGRAVIYGSTLADGRKINGFLPATKKILQDQNKWHDYLVFDNIFNKIKNGLNDFIRKLGIIYEATN